MSRWHICLISILLGASAAPAQRRGGGAAPQEPLRFRFMGPAVGNRIAAAAGVPGDPKVYYAGAASGGVWKSTDGGERWAPVSDSLPAAAIGALAVAPSDHNTVWAGTGEAWAIRDSDMMGDGIYKSTDAGQTWTHMGLDETGRIGRIVVHPTNPEIVFACALGRATGPQQERGVFRTADGGRNWQRVLFADPNTGCSGLAIDPNNPSVLFAGMWQVEMHTYAMYSGGTGSALYVSRDGGSTWKRLEGQGLPKSPVGKIDVAIARTNSKRVYALIQTADQGSVWRSDDGGETWITSSWARALIGRAGYYIRIEVSPSNPDEVLVANSSFWQSTDGGKTFRTVPWGGDTHDIWIDPANADRILVTHDAGMYMTTDHGKTSNRVTMPIGQMYHVSVDSDVPPRRGPTFRARSPAGAEAAVEAAAAARAARGSTDWAAANPVSPSPTPPTPTSSGPPATAAKSPAMTRERSSRAPSAPGSTRSIPSPTSPGTAATGPRPWPSTRSTTTPSTSAASTFSKPPTAVPVGASSVRTFPPRTPAASFLREESCPTTSASFTARWSSPSRPQRSKRASSGRVRTTERSGTPATAARAGTT
ncbi:MAG: hypothetical protein LAQ30_25700 [Acidobacteriia bacterium]|nr:hypothetical protein [Terriglobia bacterium]